MKKFKVILWFLPLAFFIACQGPYHKSNKKPIKIGIKDLAANEAEEPQKEEKKEIIDLDNKGIGPISNVELGDEIDQAMADAGEAYFNGICIACHQMNSRMVGPPLKGILERRSPEWVMNMILNPNEMIEKDPIAQSLLEEYLSPMTYMGTTEEEARQLVEYFRTVH